MQLNDLLIDYRVIHPIFTAASIVIVMTIAVTID